MAKKKGPAEETGFLNVDLEILAGHSLAPQVGSE
jgi:hypothetical protein